MSKLEDYKCYVYENIPQEILDADFIYVQTFNTSNRDKGYTIRLRVESKKYNQFNKLIEKYNWPIYFRIENHKGFSTFLGHWKIIDIKKTKSSGNKSSLYHNTKGAAYINKYYNDKNVLTYDSVEYYINGDYPSSDEIKLIELGLYD
jgi:hypothetical protein